MKTNKRHHFTPVQIGFLRGKYEKYYLPVLVWVFNETFGLALAESQIRSALRNHRILSGRTGCFEKGSKPWNLGIKGYIGPNRTSFKKGSAPPNRKPLGTERICSKDGFVLIKISETDPYTGFPTRYKHKHVHVWEQIHGPVPKGHVVSFIDGDKLNCEPENLMLLTRKELLCLNLHNYKDTPAELKPSVLALAKLEAKAGVRTHPGRGRRKNGKR